MRMYQYVSIMYTSPFTAFVSAIIWGSSVKNNIAITGKGAEQLEKYRSPEANLGGGWAWGRTPPPPPPHLEFETFVMGHLSLVTPPSNHLSLDLPLLG